MKPLLPSKRILIAALLLLLVAASAGLLVFRQGGLLELHRLREQSEALEQGNQGLRERNERLARKAELVREDPATIEGLAREQLGMVKDGEVVYYLPPPPPAKAAQGPAGKPASEGSR